MSDSTLPPDTLSGEGNNQESVPPATAPSDDLFGDDSIQTSDEVKAAAIAEDSASTVAPTATSDPVEPQSTSGTLPVTEGTSGIDGVAQFIPTDAKLDQPLVTSSDLVGAPTGASSTEQDVKMEDAPVTDSAQGSKSVPAEADQSSAVDSAPTKESDALTNGATSNSAATDGNEDAATTETVATSPPVPTPAAPAAEQADQPMSEAPSSGTVRPREDDETTDEPGAKRARTEEVKDDAQAEFKKPDAPAASADSAAPAAPAAPATPAAPAAPAAPISNGNGSHIAQRTFSSSPMTQTQKTVLLEKMKNTKKVKSAFGFLKPVDPVLLNIPQYFDIIKNPMDLSTMEKKLKSDEYSSVDDFVGDFELMINNCITFNGSTHVIAIAGQNLRAYFMKQMETVPTGESALAKPQKPKKASPKPPPRRESRAPAVSGPARSPTTGGGETYALLPSGTPMIRRDSTAGRPKRAVIPPAPRDLPYATSKPKRKEAQMGLKFCEHILDEFRRSRYDRFAAPFRTPVDPVALNIPMYFSIIKRPMDLSTMTNKLKGGQYATAQEFKADADIMFDNCFKFNPADNIVHQCGKEFQAVFEREWSKKDAWIKKNTPQSQRASPASDGESDAEESDEGEEEDGAVDNNEATIALLKEQLASMQSMVASISGAASKPAAKNGKKKSKSSAKPTRESKPAARPTIKAKPKKQRLVTYEEKQEISNATERMNEDQIEKLTAIITENVAKYKDMPGDDVELEIDDLPNDVQHKLLRYVRSLFPPRAPTDDGNAIDDDYEPERGPGRTSTGKKKHKPMKKHEQESRIKELKQKMAQFQSGLTGTANNVTAQSARASSDDDDSESSEEE